MTALPFVAVALLCSYVPVASLHIEVARQCKRVEVAEFPTRADCREWIEFIAPFAKQPESEFLMPICVRVGR